MIFGRRLRWKLDDLKLWTVVTFGRELDCGCRKLNGNRWRVWCSDHFLASLR